MSDLEKYIVELRHEMDSEEPERGHLERFSRKLKNSDPKIRKINFRHAIQIAASIAIILASGIVIVKSSKGSSKVALNPVTEEFQETTNYFARQVNARYEDISAIPFNSEKEKEVLLQELSEMDEYHKELLMELDVNPGNEQVMNALIQHYQIKLKVMDQIIEQLIQIKIQTHLTMKNLTFKTGLSFILVLFLAGVSVYGQKAEKEISKEYNISKVYTLGVDNKYGSIEVINWDKNELSVVVKIETEAATQDKADRLLDGITVDINEEKNAAYFVTDFDLPKLNGKTKFTVDYTVMAPKYLNVELEQKYGNIFIQEITGSAVIEVKYGNLDAKSITRSEAGEWNTIDVGYGNATIEETGALSAEIKYGGLTISKSDELSIESAYSKLTLGEVVVLDIESKYDKLFADGVSKSAKIESAYTQVSLGSIAAGFTEIYADMSYGNLKAELAPGVSFNIDASTAFGSIQIPEGNYNSNKDGNRHEVKGSVGNTPKANVNVSIKYGSLNFK